MKKIAFTRKSTYLAALAALLIVSFVAGTLATSNQPVDAQGANPLAPAMPAGAGPCTFGGIAAFNDVTLIYCSNVPGYVAFPTTTPAEARIANRYLATLFTGIALSKPLAVVFDDDPAHNPSPTICLPASCRLLTGLGFLP